MKYILQKLYVPLLAAGAIYFTGCKEDTIIKASLTPGVDNINTQSVDSFTILSKTVYEDTAITSGTPTNQLVVHGLGTVNDPYFGRTNAGIYLQVVPEKANFTFSANNPTITEAYLVLPYSGFAWGDTLSPVTQGFNIYRVNQNLDKNYTYYSFFDHPYDPTPLNEPLQVNVRKLGDSVNVLGTKRTPHLRIKLTEAFKNELVSIAAASNDVAAFLSAVKGLYIRSADTTVGKAIPYFVVNGANDYQRAAIQFFYYEGNNTSDIKTAFFNFVTNTTAHFNRITRSYSPEVRNLFNSTAKSDSVVMLQNLPGAAIDLRFPFLDSVPPIVVNRAELTITKISLAGDPDGDKYFEPARIEVTGIDANGNKYAILDRLPITEPQPVGFIDGSRRSVTLPNGITVTRYSLNIPREVQRAITNKTDELHLRINGVQRFFGAYRLIAGGSNSMYKVSLSITHSKLQ